MLLVPAANRMLILLSLSSKQNADLLSLTSKQNADFMIRWFGLYGLIASIIIWEVYRRIIEKKYKLEHLSGMDAFWFHDDARNYANIIAFMKFERFNAKEMKKHIFEKSLSF